MYNILDNRILVLIYVIIISCCLFSCSKKSTPSQTSRTTHSSGLRSSVIQDAKDQIGTRYRFGGINGNGFDCSGLAYFVYEKNGINLPRTSRDQASRGRKITPSAAQPGDLIFFGKGKVEHVGILVSNNKGKLSMIHSSKSEGVVETQIYTSSYWTRRLLFARSIL